MEQSTRRWVTILAIVVVLYLALVVSHTVLGVKILPW